ncbi:MAG: hypothetical protein F4X44_00960 [Gammaproteobacteria bacterium]|nr:hypothetical protein [Gammaproteobacteria bacterium]MYD79173.1 hypothetical protein [Gammaproteobacteria bacterium]
MKYEVVFARRHGVYLTSCTCKAGEHGMWCKHRTQLLEQVSHRGLEELLELLELRDEIDRQKQQIVAKLQERRAECNEAIQEYCTTPGSI